MEQLSFDSLAGTFAMQSCELLQALEPLGPPHLVKYYIRAGFEMVALNCGGVYLPLYWCQEPSRGL